MGEGRDARTGESSQLRALLPTLQALWGNGGFGQWVHLESTPFEKGDDAKKKSGAWCPAIVGHRAMPSWRKLEDSRLEISRKLSGSWNNGRLESTAL